MPERTLVEKAVLAALEREPVVNLRRWPLRVEHVVTTSEERRLAGHLIGVRDVVNGLEVRRTGGRT